MRSGMFRFPGCRRKCGIWRPYLPPERTICLLPAGKNYPCKNRAVCNPLEKKRSRSYRTLFGYGHDWSRDYQYTKRRTIGAVYFPESCFGRPRYYFHCSKRRQTWFQGLSALGYTRQQTGTANAGLAIALLFRRLRQLHQQPEPGVNAAPAVNHYTPQHISVFNICKNFSTEIDILIIS